jgi:hypothetical protein
MVGSAVAVGSGVAVGGTAVGINATGVGVGVTGVGCGVHATRRSKSAINLPRGSCRVVFMRCHYKVRFVLDEGVRAA